MHLPPHLISQFCHDIEGKTINIQAIADVQNLDPKKLKDMSEEDLLKEHQVFDKYPYAEVLDSLEEAGQFQDARKEVKRQKQDMYANLQQFIPDGN